MSKLKDLIKIDNLQEDLIAKGFHKLDDKLIVAKAPKILWGGIYQASSNEEKIEYLEKLAATMNHAASLIQDERNQLNKLCELKEQQIEKMKEAMDQNNRMIQSEVAKMNEERQKFNDSKAGLKGEALKAHLKSLQ